MFESLASCFAAYKPAFGWWKSCRLRGFAFRCSASLNMTALFSGIIAASLSDAKLTEHRIENLFHIHDADDLADCAQRLIKINRNVLAR